MTVDQLAETYEAYLAQREMLSAANRIKEFLDASADEEPEISALTSAATSETPPVSRPARGIRSALNSTRPEPFTGIMDPTKASAHDLIGDGLRA